ncbi:Na+/H+ antiporter subunit E [Pararhizobium haloflavum]|uniref:Na+/H+ antiporter subunit E n=1 Tax=Pararhizobium haloflavum TaxID=2037914 RepID=UPI000C19C1AF|nr:Na+/H+ antiporter subunit E [Pararhizobium haloflavum]
MMLVLVNILLAFAWGAVSGSFSLLNLIFGFLLGLFALSLIREQVGTPGYYNRTRRILSLVLLFLKELALSAWRVAVLVASPKMTAKPGIFALPLDVESDIEITMLANMITLTPGTLSIDVSDDRKTLYVHAIDASDADGARRDIKDGFERKIREAFH